MFVERRRVQDKVALVTGAGSGIGRAAARLLARQGARVIVSDRDEVSAASCADEVIAEDGRASAMLLDVTNETSWNAAIRSVLQHHGRLDVLVNSAGIAGSSSLAACSLEDWRRVMAVNLDGVFLGTKYAVEAMQRGGGGSIVNVASVSGITPSPGAAAYCASKAALRMFSRVVAIECADAENLVRVNVVTPGGVKTAMWQNEPFFRDLMSEHGGVEQAFAAIEGKSASQKFFTADEVAKTILYLASDESSPLTGAEIVLNRGHSA